MYLRIKAALSIFLTALMAFMMIETPYDGAPGDYVLEAIGLRPWTGQDTGLHLALFYFGALFLISLSCMIRYAIEGMKLRKRYVFVLFIALMVLFNTASGAALRTIKAHSPGLLAIGFNADPDRLDYSFQNNAYSTFTAEFQLTNYSDAPQSFSITLGSPHFRENGTSPISIQTPDGAPAFYHLNPHQSLSYAFNLNNCKPVGGPYFENGGEGGSIQEIVLTDESGQGVRLNRREFFGIPISE